MSATSPTGQHSQVVFRLDVAQPFESLLQSRSAERMDGGTVGLVKRSLEDDVDMVDLIQADKLLRHFLHQRERLHDTRSGNKHWIHTIPIYYILLLLLLSDNPDWI